MVRKRIRSKKRIQRKRRKTLKRGGASSDTIPVVVICWNNMTFIKGFVNQLKKYKNPILLLDNKSTYEPLLNYYKEIKDELKDKITIRLLEENYGSEVYTKLKQELPDIYLLSDPDLELNPNMPHNFAEILLEISNKYKAYKVGAAIKIEDNNTFIQCEEYFKGQSIQDWESQFWKNKIEDSTYELYDAEVDTTFCLVNNAYSNSKQIRIAGDFTVKHLPWYKDYIKNTVPQEELDFWKQNNKSSTIVKCLQL